MEVDQHGAKDKRWIKTCLKIASRNKIKHYKHASILVKGGRIISIGVNKTKAGCLGDPCYHLKGWHAELDCLHKVDPKDAKGAILYVGGWSKGGRVIKSKPCPYCQQYLKKFDLKAVYYSLPNYEVGAM